MIPLIPPPRTSHISFKASLSLLLFSSLGTPSDGVISPTIAIKVQIGKSTQEKMHTVKDLLIKELLILDTGKSLQHNSFVSHTRKGSHNFFTNKR